MEKVTLTKGIIIQFLKGTFCFYLVLFDKHVKLEVQLSAVSEQ